MSMLCTLMVYFLAKEIFEKNISFSSQAVDEIEIISNAVKEIINIYYGCLIKKK